MEGDEAAQSARARKESRVLWRFRREILLSAIGIAAAATAFAIGVIWGWRVLGGFLIVMAAWVFFTGEAAFLFPGLKLGYLTGRNAIAAAMASAAIGLAFIVNAKPLAQWTHRACHALAVQACEGEPICTNADMVSITSPARSVRAVRFARSCDGSKATSTHVSILAAGQSLPDEPGNAFIVDGKADLLLLWVDGKHVAISGAGNATRRLQEAVVNGVRISYEERPR
jgi:hypothetical protein